jgi:cytochrome c
MSAKKPAACGRASLCALLRACYERGERVGNGEVEVRNVLKAAAVVAMLAATTVAARADGDPEAGKNIFKKCHACHNIGEGAHNSVGPELNGVVGRKAGTVEGYSYSEANKTSGITWDVATLDVYLTDPKAKVPGTKMAFPGLPNEKDRANVIAYLSTFGPDGKPK